MTQFETSRTILVEVDVQNDFIDGSLAVPDGAAVVHPLNSIASQVRRDEGLVAFTRDWHPSRTPHFVEYGGAWPAHCIAETDGANFYSDLDIQPSDIIIDKGTGQEDGYSGYEGAAEDGTTLEQIIQPRTPRERVRVLLGGLATDYCVLNTVLDATKQALRVHEAQQGVIEIYALSDAMRAVNLQPTDEQRALDQMEQAGARLISTEEAMRNLL